jgi:hypothetical protein
MFDVPGAVSLSALWAALLGSEQGLAELAPGRRDATGRLHVRRTRDARRYPPAAEPLELADRALALGRDRPGRSGYPPFQTGW